METLNYEIFPNIADKIFSCFVFFSEESIQVRDLSLGMRCGRRFCSSNRGLIVTFE